MAHSERKRQQKLVKRQRRANELRKQRNVRQNLSDRDWVNIAQKSPWIGCFTFGADGMHQVLAVRQGRTDLLACAFLLDTYCLGVKKCNFVRGIDMDYVRDRGAQTISASHALKWIQEAIAFGAKNGFEPPASCHLLLRIFEGINSSECDLAFEFGRDGIPYFVPGPDDTLDFQLQTLTVLKKLGEGNYLVSEAQSDVNFDDYEDEFDDGEEDEYDDRPGAELKSAIRSINEFHST